MCPQLNKSEQREGGLPSVPRRQTERSLMKPPGFFRFRCFDLGVGYMVMPSLWKSARLFTCDLSTFLYLFIL